MRPPSTDSGSQRPQGATPDDAYLTSARKGDHAITLELRHAARNRLDSQAEIVGNVLAGHVQMQVVALAGFGGPFQQEGRHLFSGATTAEQQAMGLCLGQPQHGMLEKLLAYHLVVTSLLLDGVPAVYDQAAVGDRFGGELAFVSQFQAENLP